MSNPNGLLGQKSCCYLNQGRTFDGTLDDRDSYLCAEIANSAQR